ncbi:hypothetical protein [Povalibacter sp.]
MLLSSPTHRASVAFAYVVIRIVLDIAVIVGMRLGGNHKRHSA